MRRAALLGLAAVGLLITCGCRRHIEVTDEPKETPDVEKPPYLSWPDDPTFATVPGTSVRYLQAYQGKPVGSGYDVCRVGSRWYWAYKGHWFYNRKSWRGPWKPAGRIPKEFLKIPADHEKHRLARLHPDYKK